MKNRTNYNDICLGIFIVLGILLLYGIWNQFTESKYKYYDCDIAYGEGLGGNTSYNCY